MLLFKSIASFRKETHAFNSKNIWIHHNRILVSLDIGTKNIGVAVSDKSQKISLPLGLITINGSHRITNPTSKTVKYLLENKSLIGGWVVGWPLDCRGGGEGPQTRITMKILKALEGQLFPIEKVLLLDERYSSITSRHEDQQSGRRMLDVTVARIQLQHYIESISPAEEFTLENVNEKI